MTRRVVGGSSEGGTLVDGAAAADILRAQLDAVRGRSPLYEALLAGFAAAAERGFDGGVLTRLLTIPGPSSPEEARLLLLAALHHAALADSELPHAAWYATAGPSNLRPPDEGAPVALALAYLVEHEDEVAAFLRTHRLQTNEIGRCTALLPGFLLAAGLGLPLRLLEVGCAAGLNLRFDRYRYRYHGGPTWGATGAPLLEAVAEGAVPSALVPPTVEVADRRGVDLLPIDPATDAGARLLHAFAWPDDPARHARLDAAIEVARSTPATLEAGDLAAWTREHVHPEEGTTTVLFHSNVVHLVDDATLARFETAVERALRAAMSGGPFVYLRFEEPRGTAAADPELTVATSDGSGPPRWAALVTADAHGRWVRWWP